jgi:hypothetical protein
MNTPLTLDAVQGRLCARFGIWVVVQVSYELRMWRVRVFNATRAMEPSSQITSACGGTLDEAFTSLLWPDGRAPRTATVAA